ncbi:MAG: hypothetical protein Q9181_001823 [Wetmoreana brouardii]
MVPSQADDPIVCVVDFHHARGPEIESWFGVKDGTDPAADNDWSYLPFMALSDGAHAYALLPFSSMPYVTRSTVQKAVVVIAKSPQLFGHLREKLSMVTGAWFAQRDFTDMDILKVGLSLRELIYEYKHQTLVLFKCCLLQPKMLFFGSRCERLCMMQFSLISLIPNLLSQLSDCADPDLDTYSTNFVPPTSLKTSSRPSLLAYMGLPLQIFGKGSLFGPYTPLQQLDVLADYGTRSYIVGSTNSLLLQQKDRYSDILINLDDSSISISSPSLRSALALSAADRRWIDFLTQTVTSTWDPQNPSRPTTLAYMGSEEFIRLQFEEYLLALLSAVKYHLYLTSFPPSRPPLILQENKHETDPIVDFNPDWLASWQLTPSYALFNRSTDAHLFDIVEPRHPTAGNLSIEDIQRRITQQIHTLHLDDRFASTKENVSKHLATGKERMREGVEKLWSDIEAFRDAQAQKRRAAASSASTVSENEASGATTLQRRDSARSTQSLSALGSPEKTMSPAPNRFAAAAAARAPDFTTAQASVVAAGQRAGAYMSSWGAWAAEKRKGWGRVGGGETHASAAGGTVEKVVEEQGRVRSPGKKKSREVVGGDGIGRLDA